MISASASMTRPNSSGLESRTEGNTDPPYNVDCEGSTRDKLKIVNDKMAGVKFYEFLLHERETIHVRKYGQYGAMYSDGGSRGDCSCGFRDGSLLQGGDKF